MSTKKKLFIVLASVFVIMTLVYTCIAVYFMNHFYHRTTINGINVSNHTVEGAQNTIQARIDDYALTVTGRGDMTDTITGSEIGLTVEWSNELPSYMKKQNALLWVFDMLRARDYQLTVKTTYDESKLQEKIDSFVCMQAENQIQPEDARLSEYNAEDGYQIVPSVQGSKILREELVTELRNSINAVATELILDGTACYAKPMVTEDDEALQALQQKLNTVASASITYQVGNETQVLDFSVFKPWLYEGEDGAPCLKEEEVENYVKQLGRQYNTCYGARNFMTSYGQEIKITNSRYGWKVDQTAEKNAIIAELIGGQTVTRDLHYNMTANSHEGNDYGNSYVEINYTAQHLFLYVNGELVVESDFVSGDLSRNMGSPSGIFGITYCQKNATLNGPGYSTPVSYWMPFAGDVGMHDAGWRKGFGAAIYKRDGSHGCVNLPKSKAKEIFSYVQKGFPVICYELAGTQTEEGIAQDQAYVMIDAIKAIANSTITPDSEAAIKAAREQYDALSDMAKKYVTNYNKLVAAEQALARLQ